jgi:hypothetical protein
MLSKKGHISRNLEIELKDKGFASQLCWVFMNAPNLLTVHNEGQVFSLFFKTYLMTELNYKMPNAHC